MRNRTHILNIFIILLVIFLTYGNMLDNFFLRCEVSRIKGVIDGFREGVASYEQALPVVVAIYRYINLPLWGLNPLYFYLQNFIIHIINVLLFYSLCLFLFKKFTDAKPEFFALISSLLFSVIYSHSEAVLYLNGFPTLLSTLFILSSFLLYHFYKNNNNKIFYALSVIFFALSIFSHPAKIIFLFIFVIYDYLFFFRSSFLEHLKYLLKISIPYLMVILLYSGVSFFYKGTDTKNYLTNILSYNFYFLLTLLYYIFDLFLALVGLTSYMLYHGPHKYIIISDEKVLFILRYFVIMSLFLLAAFLFQSRKSKVNTNNLNKIALFGILWCIISFLPYSTRDASTVLHYRYLYLPAIGFCIFIGCIIYFLYKKLQYSKFHKIFLFVTVFVIITLNADFVYLREKDFHNLGQNLKWTFWNILRFTENKNSYVYLIGYPKTGIGYYDYGKGIKDLVDVKTQGKTKVYFAEEEDIPCHCIKESCYFVIVKIEGEGSMIFTDVSEKYRKIILQKCENK